MIKYDLKRNILSFKFLLYIMSIGMIVFIFNYISDGLPDVYFFDVYIALQWEGILVYIFPVIAALFINDTIYNEFEAGQTKYLLLYIHSKKKLFFHKIFMTIIVSFLMLITVLFFSVIAFTLWHSRTVRVIDLLAAIKIIIQILFYLMPIELVFTYIAYNSVNVVPIMLTVHLICNLIDMLIEQISFTPTSLLNKNYSYKPIVFFVYVLIGLFVNLKYVLRRDYDL